MGFVIQVRIVIPALRIAPVIRMKSVHLRENVLNVLGMLIALKTEYTLKKSTHIAKTEHVSVIHLLALNSGLSVVNISMDVENTSTVVLAQNLKILSAMLGNVTVLLISILRVYVQKRS